jgi:hypothetical protein
MLHTGALPGHEGSVVGGAGVPGVFRSESRAQSEDDHENVVIGEAM